MGHGRSRLDVPAPDDASSVDIPAWRSLPLNPQPLPGGFSELHRIRDSYPGPSLDFFTTADVSMNAGSTQESIQDARDTISQFCEQSLALHNPPPSHQDDAAGNNTALTCSLSVTSSSFKSTSTPQPVPCHLSDVEDIPSARQVLDLGPQTITVNLIVGIISIAQPRSVTTRWGTTLSLIEVLVGDDTKSGFGVTFWLSGAGAEESQVARLRRQDVVLIRNVALHVFQNKVYGQSMRRGLTQIHPLWSRHGRAHYSTRDLARKRPSTHPQMVKTSKVKDWVLDFVLAEAPCAGEKARKSWDEPPSDRQ